MGAIPGGRVRFVISGCSELVGALATRDSPFSRSGSEGREKRPGISRPSRVEKRVVPGTQLLGQFRVAQFDGPLFDVQ